MGESKADRTRASIDAIDRQILSIGEGTEALSPATVGRIVVTLGLHARAIRDARSDHLTIRGPVWRSVEVISGHLVAHVCPLVLTRFGDLLPTIDGTCAIRGDDEASVIEYADAVAAIFDWEQTVGRHVLLRTVIRKRLAGTAAMCVARVDAHMKFANDVDIPDFRRLGRELLCAEVADWALRVAGASDHAAAIALRANRAARQSVTWAARVFRKFTTSPDELSHFDAVATLAAVDELLAVLMRVQESDRQEREKGSHPFVQTIGEQALQEFVAGLDGMTHRYLEIAEQNLLKSGTAGAFVLSVLQVLLRILRLGHVLAPVLHGVGIGMGHEATVARMTAMQVKLRKFQAPKHSASEFQARSRILDTALASVGA